MIPARLHTVLRTLFSIGVLATLCIAPTQWALELRPKFYLSPADLALAITAGIWLLDIAVTRDWRRLFALPPWPSLLFIALVFASAVTAPDKVAAFKDLIQYTEYFFVGHMLFAAFLRDDAGALRRTFFALACVTAVILGLALIQYFSSTTDVLKVRGSFGNRNVLGGYLALAMPLLFSALLGVRPLWGKLLLTALLIAGLTVNLSGAAYFSVAGVIVCIAASRGPRLFIPVAVALLAWQVFVLPHLPRENDLVHFHSLALYSDSGNAERRYPDWQAAYSMALTHPWLGVGVGNYQKNVGQYYDNIPRQTGPAEPDIQNLYLVLAASSGLPSLLAFMALLACAARAACSAKTRLNSESGPLVYALTQGITGAVVAFSATAVWHPLLVRGIGLPLVFLIVLAYHFAQAKDVHGI